MTATADTTTPDAPRGALIVNLADHRPKPVAVQAEPREMPARSPELALLASLIVAIDERKAKINKGMSVRQIMQHHLRMIERFHPDEPVWSQAVAFMDRLADAKVIRS